MENKLPPTPALNGDFAEAGVDRELGKSGSADVQNRFSGNEPSDISHTNGLPLERTSTSKCQNRILLYDDTVSNSPVVMENAPVTTNGNECSPENRSSPSHSRRRIAMKSSATVATGQTDSTKPFTGLRAADVQLQLTQSILQPAVWQLNNADHHSCLSVSPSTVIVRTENDVDSKQLLKDRRGMNVDKIDLQPNGSISDAFHSASDADQFSAANDGDAVPLVCYRLKPDAEGRFGFNVRSRSDLQCALIVARVMPHSPADKAALREGDEILSINGLSTQHRSYEEVAAQIKHNWLNPENYNDSVGILDLVVRPGSSTNCDMNSKSERFCCDSATLNGYLQRRPVAASVAGVDANRPTVPSKVLTPSPPQHHLANACYPQHKPQQTPPSATITPPLGLWPPSLLTMTNDDDEAAAKAPLLSADNDCTAICTILAPPPDPSTLYGSMQILRNLLAEPNQTTLISGFEQTYQKNPDMRITCARLIGNISRNRYRDVLPYDETRVVLKPVIYAAVPPSSPPSSAGAATTATATATESIASSNNTSVIELIKEEDDDDEDDGSGDYINASHIKMCIPATNVVNHYIATQGPLASTTNDFWRMVWQQKANLIVMLTQLSEQGRPKCHQYWPALHKTLCVCGVLSVVCSAERFIYDADAVSSSNNNNTDESSSSSSSPSPTSSTSSTTASSSTAYACRREFVVTDRCTREERHVTHLQYMAWPDHGVPSHDAIHFVQFVQEVRARRRGAPCGGAANKLDAAAAASPPPTIIHCSAGVGRTGVLILMETAMCLIEAGEPVEPIAIVENMRDQRGMLIQTTAQYEFVLHCIVRVFEEKLVQPLPAHMLLKAKCSPFAAKSSSKTSSAFKQRAKPRKKAANTRQYLNARESVVRQERNCCCQ